MPAEILKEMEMVVSIQKMLFQDIPNFIFALYINFLSI